MAFNSAGTIAAAGQETAGSYGGGATTTAAWDCEVSTPSINQPFQDAPGMFHSGGSGVAARQVRSGMREAGLRIRTPLLYEGCGLLVLAGMGAVSTATDTPSSGRHTHTFSLTSPLPSLAFEVWLGTNLAHGGSDISTVMPGAVTESWSITLEEFRQAMWESNHICQDYGIPSAPGTLPGIASGGYIEHDDTTSSGFSWGSTYGFKRATISCNNAVARRSGYGTQTTLQPYAGGSGRRVIEIEIRREYEGDTLRAAWIEQAANGDLTITHTEQGGSNKFRVVLHNAKIVRYTPPDLSSPGAYLEEVVVFRGFADAGSGESGLELEFENSQTSAVAA